MKRFHLYLLFLIFTANFVIGETICYRHGWDTKDDILDVDGDTILRTNIWDIPDSSYLIECVMQYKFYYPNIQWLNYGLLESRFALGDDQYLFIDKTGLTAAFNSPGAYIMDTCDINDYIESTYLPEILDDSRFYSKNKKSILKNIYSAVTRNYKDRISFNISVDGDFEFYFFNFKREDIHKVKDLLKGFLYRSYFRVNNQGNQNYQGLDWEAPYEELINALSPVLSADLKK